MRHRSLAMKKHYQRFLEHMGDLIHLIDTQSHHGFEAALSRVKSLMGDAAHSGDLVNVRLWLNTITALEDKLALLPDELRQIFCSSFCQAFTPSAKILAIMPSPDPDISRLLIQTIIDHDTHPFDEIANLPAVATAIPTDYRTLAALLDFLIYKSASVEEDISFRMGYPDCIGDLIQNVVRGTKWPKQLSRIPEVLSEQHNLFLEVVAKNSRYLLAMADAQSARSVKAEKYPNLWGVLVRNMELLFSLARSGFPAAEDFYHYSAHQMFWRYVASLAETGFLPSLSLVEKNLKESLSRINSNYWSITLRFHFISKGAMPLPENFFSMVYGEDVCNLINEICATSTRDDVDFCLKVIDEYIAAQPNSEKIRSPEPPGFIIKSGPEIM